MHKLINETEAVVIPRLLIMICTLTLTMAISGCGTSLAVPTSTSTSSKGQVVAPEQAVCTLRLELPAVVSHEARVKVRVEIKNVGKPNVTLVKLGDGSAVGWRTPIVGWSILPADSKEQHPKQPQKRMVARCGNINALKLDELFTLKPGETMKLGDWNGFPHDIPPGKYRVVYYYSNVPDLKWSGVPLGNHDANAMREVKNSTPIALVSNELQVEVVK